MYKVLFIYFIVNYFMGRIFSINSFIFSVEVRGIEPLSG